MHAKPFVIVRSRESTNGSRAIFAAPGVALRQNTPFGFLASDESEH
jgi:hypothetical protein